MPKSANQKLKLIYLQRILEEQTDAEHALSTNELIDALARLDISAERKSIYDDIQALIQTGMDIETKKLRANEYSLVSRSFELPELKLLADAVASSKFITEKKSNELIHKIEKLASNYEASQLRRQVIVSNRVKTMNEKIYYNVDKLHEAISQGRQISFRYFQYNLDLKKEYKYNGERYLASPYALSWDDENYYLVGYYERTHNIANFRVDKMESIEVLEDRRRIPPADFDIASYSGKLFSMFGGKQQTVKLRFDNSLIGVVIDRFGIDTYISKSNDGTFSVYVDVIVSQPFFSWLFQFGNKVKILSPADVAEKAKTLAAEISSLYADSV